MAKKKTEAEAEPAPEAPKRAKRYQVLLDPDLARKIGAIASALDVTVPDWGSTIGCGRSSPRSSPRPSRCWRKADGLVPDVWPPVLSALHTDARASVPHPLPPRPDGGRALWPQSPPIGRTPGRPVRAAGAGLRGTRSSGPLRPRGVYPLRAVWPGEGSAVKHQGPADPPALKRGRPGHSTRTRSRPSPRRKRCLLPGAGGSPRLRPASSSRRLRGWGNDRGDSWGTQALAPDWEAGPG